MFEREYRRFVEEQKNRAVGRRLEMLEKDMVGEEKLFKEVLWPVFGSFKGFVIQYELVTLTGVDWKKPKCGEQRYQVYDRDKLVKAKKNRPDPAAPANRSVSAKQPLRTALPAPDKSTANSFRLGHK